MLRVENLNAWYDRSHVLQGISLEVNKGEIVTLMGRNGAGKTTTLRALMGLLSKRQGSAFIDGTSFLDMPAHSRFHLGLAYVPEDRRIVPGLTVKENLELGIIAQKNRGDMSALVDEIAETFPRLKERLNQDGTSMSGGEQQMLAMARILRTGAKLLLLDEITEGLAPVIVQTLGRVIRQLKAKGLTIILVEQNFRFAALLADRHYVIEHGKIEAVVKKEELAEKADMLNEFLGV